MAKRIRYDETAAPHRSAAAAAANEKIDESLKETFPASDAPSWGAPVRVGSPRRSPSPEADQLGPEQNDPGKQDETDNSWSKTNMAQILSPGKPAPDFTLRVTPDQFLSLSDLRSRPVILAFYPADWSPVCGDQMTLYNEILPEFRKHDAELLGISVDGAWCHQAFARDRHLHFPLLADFEPKGTVSKKYGAYRKGEGVSERALFVLDSEGVIFWSYRSPVAVNPGADGILEALEKLSSQRGAHEHAKSSSHAA
jgi:peroxiredoxin